MKPKSTKPQKPVAPIQKLLKLSWCVWIVHRLIVYPLVVAMFGGGAFGYGVMWQVVVLFPALLFSKAIWQGKSPYALLWASMVMLVYLGAIGVFLLMRFYENGESVAVIGALLVEFVVMLGINVLLFMLLKRLPPMHKEKTHE